MNLYFFCSDFALLVKDSLEHLVRLGFGKRLVRRELRDDPMHLLSYRLAMAVPIVVFLPATEKLIATGCVEFLRGTPQNRVKVGRQRICRHQLENDTSKQKVPRGLQPSNGDWR